MAASCSCHGLVDEDRQDELRAVALLTTCVIGQARRAELSLDCPDESALVIQLCGPGLRTAFRGFSVWLDAFGLWHARPTSKLTTFERARRLAPELTADSLISLAILCIWHRNRRAIAEYF